MEGKKIEVTVTVETYPSGRMATMESSVSPAATKGEVCKILAIAFATSVRDMPGSRDLLEKIMVDAWDISARGRDGVQN
jgi:hypothetical protein